MASKEQGLHLSPGLSPLKTLNRRQVGSFREQPHQEISGKGSRREKTGRDVGATIPAGPALLWFPWQA